MSIINPKNYEPKKHNQKKRFNSSFISTDFKHINFSIIAKGFGIRSYTIFNIKDLSSALENEKLKKGPAVIDIITDQWETPVLRATLNA